MNGETKMESENKEFSDGFLGLFVLIALIMLACAWSWLKSYYPLQTPQRFSVMFHDVAGLIPNSAVNVNGVRVGTVERIELRGKRDVLVHIKINSPELKVPSGSQFEILINGVVGARYVEVGLPDVNPQSPAHALNEQDTEVGLDPVRPEVIVNKVLTRLDAIDIDKFHDKIVSDMDRLTDATDSLARLSHKFEPVADKAVIVEDKISLLSDDFRGTSRKLNHLIGDPNLTADLKETATKAESTAQGIRDSMRTLNETLTNVPVRQDVLTALKDLNQSTLNVKQSVEAMNKLSANKEMRSDVKDILTQTNQALSQANGLVNEPGFGGDLRETLHDTRQAVQHMDTVAQQVNQVLDRRHPLVHMIFGRPGHISLRRTQKTVEQTQTPAQTQEKVTVNEEQKKPDAL
jgi:ABC-type transporter Mla subunit MlaD